MKFWAYRILAIIIGAIVGVVVGGYSGLIIGGTFLGGFNIYEKIGIEGYEITTYLGSIIGVLIVIPLLLKFFNQTRESH